MEGRADAFPAARGAAVFSCILHNGCLSAYLALTLLLVSSGHGYQCAQKTLLTGVSTGN